MVGDHSLESAGWAAFVKDGKLHPLVTHGIFKERQRVYPRSIEELENWDTLKHTIDRQSKWKRLLKEEG